MSIPTILTFLFICAVSPSIGGHTDYYEKTGFRTIFLDQAKYIYSERLVSARACVQTSPGLYASEYRNYLNVGVDPSTAAVLMTVNQLDGLDSSCSLNVTVNMVWANAVWVSQLPALTQADRDAEVGEILGSALNRANYIVKTIIHCCAPGAADAEGLAAVILVWLTPVFAVALGACVIGGMNYFVPWVRSKCSGGTAAAGAADYELV